VASPSDHADEIKTRWHAGGVSRQELADQFHLSLASISRIISGRIYGSAPGETKPRTKPSLLELDAWMGEHGLGTLWPGVGGVAESRNFSRAAYDQALAAWQDAEAAAA
jgi:hypothetical protein